MIILVALDDRNGMMFNGRRQSKDRVLREKILSRVEVLWMNEYSAKQFEETDAFSKARVGDSQGEKAGDVLARSLSSSKIKVDENFLDKAGASDVCFVENADVTPFLDKIEKIVVCRWNKKYPADLFFSIDLLKWKLLEAEEIEGFSHDKITIEVYGK